MSSATTSRFPSDRIRTLLAWCTHNGIRIDPRLELVDDENAGISVRSKDLIPCSTSLVSIPKSAVLSARSCSLSDHIEHAPYGIGAQLALALAVHSELLGGEASRWFGYLTSLPHADDGVGIGLFWGSDVASDETGPTDADGTEAARWLQRTQASAHFVSETGRSIVEEVRDFYHDAVHPLLARLGLPTTLGAFCHAFALVSSRAFVVDAYHGLSMVPIADAFNHTQDHHVHLESDHDVCAVCGALFECPHDREAEASPELVPRDAAQMRPDADESTCEMVSNATIPPGVEVFNTYGEKLTNAELLVHYGFALDGNDNDMIVWTAEAAWAASSPTGASSWGDSGAFMEVLETWRGHQEWADSALVSSDITGEHAADDLSSRDNAPLLCVRADGSISHSLWVMCALISLYQKDEKSKLVPAYRTIGLLKHVAEVQNHVERTSLGEVVTQPKADTYGDDVACEILGGIIHTVDSLCRGRLNRLREGTDLDSSAAMGDYVDAIPVERSKTRLAVMECLSEMSMLEGCLAGWMELDHVLLSIRRRMYS